MDGASVEYVNESLQTFHDVVDAFQEVHKSVQCSYQTRRKKKRRRDHVDWYEPRITKFRYWLKEIGLWKKEQIAQQRTEPQDNILNVSRKSAGSKVSSSASSARKKAAAENAALLAKAAA